MLIRAGTVMILVSLLVTSGAAATVLLRSEDPETTAVSAEPQAIVKLAGEGKFDPGQKLEIDDRAGKDERMREDDGRLEDVRASNGDETSNELIPKNQEASELEPAPQPKSAPISEPIPNWPQPTADELAFADGSRYYQSMSDTAMTLTIEALGLYDVPVISSGNLEALDRGLMHEPETSLPWDRDAQRNVFIAGHYLGWPGTASHLVFYNLDKLRQGDEVILEDRRGRVYRYRVSEVFEATPDDSWVMGQVRNRDMLTLQTCIPPTFEERLVVRADRA